MNKVGNYLAGGLKTARPHQWTKNLVIFAGIFFAQQFFDRTSQIRAFFAFFAFCLLSSVVYTFNDIIDIERDKLHPQKKNRPIPSGKLPLGLAYFQIFIMLFIAMALSFYISLDFLIISGLYIALQTAYSLKLKRVVILDVMAISLGFVLRAMAGAIAVEVEISHWLLICTLLLALFLALAKRKSELKQVGMGKQREILSEYSGDLLDMMMAISTTMALMGYALYTVSPDTIVKFGTDKLVYTIPFVIYGIFRYLYLIYLHDQGQTPSELLLRDKGLYICIIFWIFTVFIILY